MAYDAGNCELAWRYMVQALRLSHAVDNRLFGARVLAAMSHQALYLDQVPLALDLALAAREGTKHIAPPKAQAMLAAMEACAQAADQRARPCVTALVEAETSLDRMGADDEPDWLDFDQGGLSGHAARALQDLRVLLPKGIGEQTGSLHPGRSHSVQSHPLLDDPDGSSGSAASSTRDSR
jgi:hypothetical protein